MKILILSVSAGGGHSNAAKALKDYTLMDDPSSKVKIIDTLKYVSPFVDKIVIGSYLKSIKITPSLFGKLYDFTETDDGLSSMTNKFNEIMADKILPLINEFEPDIIIATHPFTCEMLSILKSKKYIDLPTMCIMTDYAAHTFWIHPNIDAYVVSNTEMKNEMITRGVNSNKIYDIGIPVNPEFICDNKKQETLNELNLASNKPTLLVMGGSLGIGKIKEIYKQINSISKDIQIIVIAGKNKKLYSELIKLKKGSKKDTKIIAYTEEVSKYMQASDLLITKPGGLTIAEALICQTPLALFTPIPGQEEQNAQFLIRHELAVDIGNEKNCLNVIEHILSKPSILETMKKNCLKFSKPSAGNDIIKLINELIKKREAAISLEKDLDD